MPSVKKSLEVRKSKLLAVKSTGKVQKKSKKGLGRQIKGKKINVTQDVEFCEKTENKTNGVSSHTLEFSKVTQGVSELLRINSEHNASKSELFDTEGQPVFLTVAAIRIANTPRRIVRFVLPNVLLQETSDVALIVRDLEPRKRRPDNDAVIQLYESRIQTQGIKHPIKVIPIRQVMTEHNTYEAKRQLANQYDVFLADAHISNRLTSILGKAFSQKRVNPIPVKVDSPEQMKVTIERALQKTGMRVSADGGTMTVQVGHTQQTPKQITENIMCVLEGLCVEFPGGWPNIRNLIIKTAKSPGIPLYVSIRNPSDVHLVSTKPKQKHAEPVEGELSTQMDRRVRVQPGGNVVLLPSTKKKRKKSNTKNAAQQVDDEGEDDGIDEDEFEDLEDMDAEIDDEAEEEEKLKPETEDKAAAYNESDSEDLEADEAEEAYLAELSSTTSHLKKKNKKEKKDEYKSRSANKAEKKTAKVAALKVTLEEKGTIKAKKQNKKKSKGKNIKDLGVKKVNYVSIRHNKPEVRENGISKSKKRKSQAIEGNISTATKKQKTEAKVGKDTEGNISTASKEQKPHSNKGKDTVTRKKQKLKVNKEVESGTSKKKKVKLIEEVKTVLSKKQKVLEIKANGLSKKQKAKRIDQKVVGTPKKQKLKVIEKRKTVSPKKEKVTVTIEEKGTGTSKKQKIKVIKETATGTPKKQKAKLVKENETSQLKNQKGKMLEKNKSGTPKLKKRQLKKNDKRVPNKQKKVIVEEKDSNALSKKKRKKT